MGFQKIIKRAYSRNLVPVSATDNTNRLHVLHANQGQSLSCNCPDAFVVAPAGPHGSASARGACPSSCSVVFLVCTPGDHPPETTRLRPPA
eukprot:5002488-Prymnesium_polylepis.1